MCWSPEQASGGSIINEQRKNNQCSFSLLKESNFVFKILLSWNGPLLSFVFEKTLIIYTPIFLKLREFKENQDNNVGGKARYR